jgi:cell division protein FtsI (penicillin-binding protein 3)
VLRPKGRPWYDVETANASFGQGISVTTVQLAVAMGAIANAGKLMEPILVRKITDTRGTVVKEWTPHVRREAVPAGIAKMVSEMLTAVVEEGGTGVEAAMSGFRVAGKTATAQKVDPATGKYSEDKYTASFVGFVPADKPRLVVAVVLDEPMIGRYGGDLAGPVFRRVAEASLRYLGVPPTHVTPRIKTVTRTGDLADATLAAMKESAGAGKPDPSKPGSAPPGPPALPGLLAAAGPPAPSDVRVPDALGMGTRAAVRRVGNAGLVPLVEGSGRLVKQVPSPGTPTPKGSSVRLVFEPAS